MKSYGHLWEKLITDQNIKLAIKNSSARKRKRLSVKKVFENQDEYVLRIRKEIEFFKNEKHKPRVIRDGLTQKERTIIVPRYNEQIVHHMVVNVLVPIIMRGMYKHSYASIPGRGAHKGKKYIKKWIDNDKKNVKFCLKMDIRKFF